MTKLVDYYLTLNSPWTYLGHARLSDILAAHGAVANVKPVDFGRIFPPSGGLPLAKRPPQRRAYRLMELRRWRAYLGVPLTLEPKFFPVNPDAAARHVIAAVELHGWARAMDLAGAILRAVWVEERNIADLTILADIARSAGFDANVLASHAAADKTRTAYDTLTQEAIDRQVFGAPTYVYRDELFWGQDRLDFLERALAT